MRQPRAVAQRSSVCIMLEHQVTKRSTKFQNPQPKSGHVALRCPLLPPRRPSRRFGVWIGGTCTSVGAPLSRAFSLKYLSQEPGAEPPVTRER